MFTWTMYLGPWKVCQAHSGTDPGCVAGTEELPGHQVPHCAADSGGCGRVPLSRRQDDTR